MTVAGAAGGWLARALGRIGRAGPNALPVGILLGLVVPGLADIARPYLTPAIFLLLAVTMVRADPTQVVSLVRRPARVTLLLLALLGVMPAAIAWALPIDSLPESMGQAIVLYALSPPVIAGAAIAAMLGLNFTLVLVCSMIATILVPLTLPPLALSLLGVALDIGTGELMLRLGVLVGGAAACAIAARRIAGPERIEANADAIAGGFVLLMLVFAVSIMDSVRDRLLTAPGEVLTVLALAFATNLGLQIAGLVMLPWLGRSDGTAAAMIAGNRNMGVVIAALGLPSESPVFLFFALIQVPIFVLPAALRPLYRRLATGRS